MKQLEIILSGDICRGYIFERKEIKEEELLNGIKEFRDDDGDLHLIFNVDDNINIRKMRFSAIDYNDAYDAAWGYYKDFPDNFKDISEDIIEQLIK